MQRSSRLWLDLALEYPQFDRREQLVAALEAADYPSWQAFVSDLLGAEAGSLLISSGDSPVKTATSWSSRPQLQYRSYR